MRTSERHHRDKRQFQPTITNYFAARQDLDDSDDDSRGEQHTRDARSLHPTLAPSVPGRVQADLLSVGMRVRKSVPEGYKTHKKGGVALPSIQTQVSQTYTTTTSTTYTEVTEGEEETHPHQRELLPFCGLHKIGGLDFAAQPTTNPHLYGVQDAQGQRATNIFPLPASAFSQPFSSQGSTDSGYGSDFTQQTRPVGAKRGWSEDDEESRSTFPSSTRTTGAGNFLFAMPFKPLRDTDDVPISPLSSQPLPNALHSQLPPSSHPTRTFAQPRSRTKALDGDAMDLDDGARMVQGRVLSGSGSDFEEADFLDEEVRMGGV